MKNKLLIIVSSFMAGVFFNFIPIHLMMGEPWYIVVDIAVIIFNLYISFTKIAEWRN